MRSTLSGTGWGIGVVLYWEWGLTRWELTGNSAHRICAVLARSVLTWPSRWDSAHCIAPSAARADGATKCHVGTGHARAPAGGHRRHQFVHCSMPCKACAWLPLRGAPQHPPASSSILRHPPIRQLYLCPSPMPRHRIQLASSPSCAVSRTTRHPVPPA